MNVKWRAQRKTFFKRPKQRGRLLFISLQSPFLFSTFLRRKKCAREHKKDNDRGELNAQRRECNWKFFSSMVSFESEGDGGGKTNCVIEAHVEWQKGKNLKSLFNWNEILKLNRAQLPQLILRFANTETRTFLFIRKAFNQPSNTRSTFVRQKTFFLKGLCWSN